MKLRRTKSHPVDSLRQEQEQILSVAQPEVIYAHARQFASGLAQFRAYILWKNSFNVKYLENGDRYHDGVNGSRIWNRPWMSINSMTFDLRWPRTVLGQGH